MIVGAMRLYPASLHFLKWTLPPLLKVTHRQVFLLHGLSATEVDILPGATLGYWCGAWDHQGTLNELFSMADCLRPEWVVYPDSDEILPTNLLPGLIAQAESRKKNGVSFPFAVPFGGFDYQLERGLVPTDPHMKVLRWKPQLDFRGTAGFCIPKGDYDGNAVQSPAPLLHLYYMTEEARAERRKQGRVEGFAANPRLVPAPPSWRDDYGVTA